MKNYMWLKHIARGKEDIVGHGENAGNHFLLFYKVLNSLSKDKILDFTKLKVFVDDKINVAKMIILAKFILKTL